MAAGLLLVAAALVIGVVPVHERFQLLCTENGPCGTASATCGSPLFKERASYKAPFEGIRFEGHDPCSLDRDHRRGPIKIVGGAGVLVLAAGSADAVLIRRRRKAAGPA